MPVDRTYRTIDSHSAAMTHRVGALLGERAAPGDVLLLQGDLGTGKTTFTQGFVAGVGSTELVNSPTFVLLNEYRGRVMVYHADLYRLDDPADVDALGLANLSRDGVLIVEWPERDCGSLPSEHLLIRLEHAGADRRTLHLQPRGARAMQMADSLATVQAG